MAYILGPAVQFSQNNTAVQTVALAIGSDGTVVANYTSPNYSGLNAWFGLVQSGGTIAPVGTDWTYDDGEQGGVAIDPAFNLVEAHETNGIGSTIYMNFGAARNGQGGLSGGSVEMSVDGGNVRLATIGTNSFLATTNSSSTGDSIFAYQVQVNGRTAIWNSITFSNNQSSLPLGGNGSCSYMNGVAALCGMNGGALGPINTTNNTWFPNTSFGPASYSSAVALGANNRIYYVYLNQFMVAVLQSGTYDDNCNIIWDATSSILGAAQMVSLVSNGNTLVYAYTINNSVGYVAAVIPAP